jgi:large subunit ribosomal protein L19
MIEHPQFKTTHHPTFHAGDTVAVKVKIKEGNNRERLQTFEGVVLLTKNMNRAPNINASFTVRKISHGVGVERVFPLYSPNVVEIQVLKHGDVNQARIYYLRERSGKSARIKEKIKRKV